MKIGIVSDTHKHLNNLVRAVAQLRKLGAETIIHLGDDYSDCDDAGESGIVRVPGVYSDQYRDPDIPNRRLMEICGWQVLLSHTRDGHPNDREGDLNPETLIRRKQVDVVLYGHTHLPDARVDRGIVFINPGHLKDEDKKGSPATYALVEFNEHDATAFIYRLVDNTPLVKEQFRR